MTISSDRMNVSQNFIKYAVIIVEILNIQYNLTDARFREQPTTLSSMTDNDKESFLSAITNLIDNFVSFVSRWKVHHVMSLSISFAPYQPMQGSSYIHIPNELLRKQAGWEERKISLQFNSETLMYRWISHEARWWHMYADTCMTHVWHMYGDTCMPLLSVLFREEHLMTSHISECSIHPPQLLKYPSPKHDNDTEYNILKFKNFAKMVYVPMVLYCDFETFFVPVEDNGKT